MSERESLRSLLTPLVQFANSVEPPSSQTTTQRDGASSAKDSSKKKRKAAAPDLVKQPVTKPKKSKTQPKTEEVTLQNFI